VADGRREITYEGDEKMVKAGVKNACVHKGLFSAAVEKQFPNLRGYADAADVERSRGHTPDTVD
jgi:uncharacterized protein